MIVKVQLSMPDKKNVLVYDKSRKHLFEGRSNKKLISLLKSASDFEDGGYKAFFHAKLVSHKNNGIRFDLGNQAEWQDW